MRNLLSANLLRLKKSGLFWGLLLSMFLLGALMSANYWQMNQWDSLPLDGAFFTYPILSCIVTAVFVPLFFGAEYSGHTIRNKVAAGLPRPLIYAANLLTAIAASLLFCAAYMAAVAVVGVPLVGPIEMDAAPAALITLGSLAAVAALCAIFIFVAMTCDRKSLSAAACVLGVFLLLFASIYLRSRLLSPEYLNGSWNTKGEFIPGEPRPNPQYLGGAQRAVFEVLYALLPTSQAIEFASQQTQDPYRIALYSVTVIVLFTGIGISLFRRKDLK